MLTLYRLSLAWGVPVSVLSDALTAAELRGYQTYYTVEPWGCLADDQRAGLVAYTTAQAWSKRKLRFRDFVIQRHDLEQDPAAMMAGFAAAAAAHNDRQERRTIGERNRDERGRLHRR